jgi:hypothetical protein
MPQTSVREPPLEGAAVSLGKVFIEEDCIDVQGNGCIRSLRPKGSFPDPMVEIPRSDPLGIASWECA